MELEINLTQYQGMVEDKDNQLRAITSRLQLEEEEKGQWMVLRNIKYTLKFTSRC